MKKLAKLFGGATMFVLPTVVLAQTGDLGGVSNWVTGLGRIVNGLLPIVFALALLYFFWGLAKYILSAGDEDKAKEGKGIMIYGLIAIFIMASVWGIVVFVQRQLGITTNPTSIPSPGVDDLPR